MNQRLEQLAAHLDSIPEPGDIVQQAQFSLLKAQGKLLSHLPTVSGDVAQKRQILVTSNESINTTAGMLGERHEGIIILRKMVAIATAIVDGNPEPTDAELSRQFGGSGTGGCFSVVLMVGVGIGGLVGFHWT